MTRRITSGDTERGLRDVQADAVSRRSLVQDRDTDAAGARPDIADARWRVACAQQTKRRFDQQLRFGTRDEHIRRNLKIKIEELLMTRDVLQRLTFGATLDVFAEAPRIRRR